MFIYSICVGLSGIDYPLGHKGLLHDSQLAVLPSVFPAPQ